MDILLIDEAFYLHHKYPDIVYQKASFWGTYGIFGFSLEAMDSQSRGPVFKTTSGSKVDSAFHHCEVDKMSTKNFWELSGKSKMPP